MSSDKVKLINSHKFKRYSDDSFSATHMATIGVDFKLKSKQYEDRKIKIQVKTF
jgi:hypothetical protein